MIIVLNGYPGVGKLTIGRELASTLNGRLLDNHTVYNVAFALTEFRSPEFWEAVKKVEAIAHDLILKLPKYETVVLTTVLAGDSEVAKAEWSRIVSLGESRPPFCVVHVACGLDENIRRIQSPERQEKLKPRDPDMARKNQANAETLLGFDASRFLKLDTTLLPPEVAAQEVSEWTKQI